MEFTIIKLESASMCIIEHEDEVKETSVESASGDLF